MTILIFFQDQIGHFDYILENLHKIIENVGFTEPENVQNVMLNFTLLALYTDV